MNLLEHVLGIRLLIHRSFSGKMERLGIGLTQYEERSGLSDEDITLRQRLIDINNTHLQEKDGNFKAARDYTLKQCVFTLFNRLAAIKLMEQKQLFPEVIKQRVENGGLSAAHQMWLEEHPEGRSMERDGLAAFLSDKFNEMAEHNFLLYNQNYPYAMMPTADELNEIVQAFNAIENDPDCADTWQKDDILGWLYENFNSAEKVEFKESGDKTEYDKVSLQSQVYTPSWVVKFLVDNSLGKLYLEMFPDSQLDAPDMDGHRRIAVANRPTECTRRPKDLTELKIIDPACGSGNFLLYSFSLLYDMYMEQMERYGKLYERREIPALIVENNIYGVDLDERAVQLAQIGLLIKAREMGGRRARMPKHTNVVCSNFYLPRYDEVRPYFGYDTSWGRKYDEAARKIWTDLSEAHKFGTLVRVEEQLNELAPNADNHSFFSVDEMGELFDERERLKTQLRNQVFKYSEHNANRYSLLKMSEAMTFLDVVSTDFDVVVANPPYTDSGDFGTELKKFVEDNYKKPLKFNSNLYACFIKRCCELAGDDGKVGMVNPPTFMYIKTFEDLRKHIISNTHISLFVEWGYLGMFSSFARVDSAMFVLDMDKRKEDSTFIKLDDLYETKRKGVLFKAFDDYCNGICSDRIYNIPQSKLKGIKSWPFIYWISDEFRAQFGKRSLGDILSAKKGLGTENIRFFRFWWEINKSQISKNYNDDHKKWVTYLKGGPYNKWYGNLWLVVNWENDGYEIKHHPSLTLRNPDTYFKKGIGCTLLSSKGCSFRIQPENCIYDSTTRSIFISDNKYSEEFLLALLNSKLTLYTLDCLNSTVATNSDDVHRVPLANFSNSDYLLISNLSKQNISIKKYLCKYSIIEQLFEASPINTVDSVNASILSFYNLENALLTQVLLNESVINSIIFNAYGLNEHDKKMVIEREKKPIADFPVTKSSKKLFLDWISSNQLFPLFNEVINHINNLEEVDDLIQIKDFNLLYQSNKDWEQFCIDRKINPIEVWYQFKNCNILPPIRTQALSFELITDVVRSLLEKDDDGVIPLSSNSGESSLVPRMESELIERGYTSAQISQIFGLLSGGNVEKYMLEKYFSQLSDYLNLFQYLPKTPFIWHITSGSHHALELYASIYTWSRDTLMRIKSVYAANREAALNDRLQVLQQGDAIHKVEAAEVRAQLKELNDFRDKIDQLLSSGYNPKLDDGVGKNIAPLQKAGIISYDVLKSTQLKKYLNADW